MNLNRAVIFILTTLTLSSCSVNSDENVRPITTNPFLETKKCYLVMGNLIEEWKKYGGGYKKSIKTIREQISNDHNS
ncbi:MAG: hypothetical protein KDI92_16160, partial [Xanthomonadales bacterium]|nr:hypothetical protein [Xanthomonadales bacterium]